MIKGKGKGKGGKKGGMGAHEFPYGNEWGWWSQQQQCPDWQGFNSFVPQEEEAWMRRCCPLTEPNPTRILPR